MPSAADIMHAAATTDMEGFVASLSCGVDTTDLTTHVSQGTLTDVCDIKDAVNCEGKVADLTLQKEELRLELAESVKRLETERAEFKLTSDTLKKDIMNQVHEELTHLYAMVSERDKLISEKDDLIRQYRYDHDCMVAQLNDGLYNPPQPYITQRNKYRNRNNQRR